LKRLDSRFHGNDKSPGFGRNSKVSVSDEECLARFICHEIPGTRSRFLSEIRSCPQISRSDQTVRPDAFIPHPYPDLSVTRHTELSNAELWQVGQSIANNRSRTLYGRADIQALEVKKRSLCIQPTLTPKNHANINGWPVDKPAQKMIAQELADVASFTSKP
jgi:hypothetical protein